MEYVNKKLHEFEEFIYNKNVAVVGLSLTNLPLLDYLCDKRANVTVFDERIIDEIDKVILDKITERCIKFSFGKHTLINLVGFDIIFRSSNCRPDLPEIQAECLRGAILTSDLEMVTMLCPGTVIGVVGTSGRITTADLIYNILKENREDCYIGGSTKKSLFKELQGMTDKSFIVVEFNDYDLSTIQHSPDIAVIPNIEENTLSKLNISFEEYMSHIKNIIKYQTEQGIAVLNYDTDITKYISTDIQGKVRFFSIKNKLDNGVIYDNGTIKFCDDGVRRHIVVIDDAISLNGEENFQNICAAVAATSKIVAPDIQARAIIKFKNNEDININFNNSDDCEN